MSDDRNKHGVYMPAAEAESKRRNYAKSTPTANVVRAVGTRTVAGVFGDLRQVVIDTGRHLFTRWERVG